MKPWTFLKMGHIGSKARSPVQIIEDPMLVTKGLWLKSLLLNSIPHKARVSDSRAIMDLLLYNVKFIPLGSYLGSARAHPILHRNKAGNLQKNFFWQTIMARAFIFGTWHYLMSLYQNIKIILLRSYLGSARAHPMLHRNKEGNLLKSTCDKQ